MSVAVEFDVPEGFFTGEMNDAFIQADEPSQSDFLDKKEKFPEGQYVLEILGVKPGIAQDGKYKYVNVNFKVIGGPEQAIGQEDSDHRPVNTEGQLRALKGLARRLDFHQEGLNEVLAAMAEELPGAQYECKIVHKEGRNGGSFMNVYWNKRTN